MEGQTNRMGPARQMTRRIYKGMSFPGGGCFGSFQALTLARVNPFRLQRVDATAGTSIGSVMALTVALRNRPGEVSFMFLDAMPRIWAGRWWRRFKWPLPRYSDRALNATLKKWFGDALFEQCAIPCAITAWPIGRGRPKVFVSTDPADGKIPAWEIARMSCAAPTYFSDWRGYWDGGLCANNPCMVLLAEMIKAGHYIDDIEIFSLATGHVPASDLSEKAPRTYTGTADEAIQALLDGASDIINDKYAQAVLGTRYSVADFESDKKWRMDDPDTATAIYKHRMADVHRAAAMLNAWLAE